MRRDNDIQRSIIFNSIVIHYLLMEELIDIVDDDDRPISSAPKEAVHSAGLVHRSVFFYIFDDYGRILVSQRSDGSEFYPGYWSIAFGGHVHKGESYDAAVQRKLKEVAGLEAEPAFIVTYKKRYDDQDRENARIYAFFTNEEPHPDPIKIKSGGFMAMDELEARMMEEKFTPETLTLYETARDFLAIADDITRNAKKTRGP
jgi:isopentenyl-diphosphate Delta-isomerase